MEKTFEVISKLIEKLKIKEIIIALLIASVIILFAPDQLLGTLGLLAWRDNYRSFVGATLLICIILCLIWIVSGIIEVIKGTGATKRGIKKYLKKLISNDERQFLIDHFYDFESGEFKASGTVSMASGYASSLSSAMIIYRATNVGHNVSYWPYNLYPYVRIYLNNAIKKNKIIIDVNGKFVWKL